MPKTNIVDWETITKVADGLETPSGDSQECYLGAAAYSDADGRHRARYCGAFGNACKERQNAKAL